MTLTNSPDAGSSKGFFDSSVGAQFANRRESPKKAAPAPKQSSPTASASGKLLILTFCPAQSIDGNSHWEHCYTTNKHAQTACASCMRLVAHRFAAMHLATVCTKFAS